jgi:hypothetical protein
MFGALVLLNCRDPRGTVVAVWREMVAPSFSLCRKRSCIVMAAATIADFLLPELERLLATATRELLRHVGVAGRCERCGERWPCERVETAALILDAF